jgi:hypothetical protein
MASCQEFLFLRKLHVHTGPMIGIAKDAAWQEGLLALDSTVPALAGVAELADAPDSKSGIL